MWRGYSPPRFVIGRRCGSFRLVIIAEYMAGGGVSGGL